MELSVYKMADLQRFRSMLLGLQRDGVETVDQALSLLTGMVADQHAAMTKPVSRAVDPSTVELCPSCGKGVVVPWPRISAQVGADVFGCKRCQWSEVR